MTLRRIFTELLFRILHHATYRFIERYTAVHRGAFCQFSFWWIADLLTSSHPQMSASHLLALQGPQQTPAYLTLYFEIIDDRMSHSQKQKYLNSLSSSLV